MINLYPPLLKKIAASNYYKKDKKHNIANARKIAIPKIAAKCKEFNKIILLATKILALKSKSRLLIKILDSKINRTTILFKVIIFL